MSEVFIPFHQDMQEASVNGNKECTSRTKKYGSIGDIFKIMDKTFEIIAVEKHTVEYVAYNLFRLEGFSSPQGFIDKWVSIHPVKKYDPNQVVFVHFYKMVD